MVLIENKTCITKRTVTWCITVCVVTTGELDGMIMLWNVVGPVYRVQMLADERVNPTAREMRAC